MHVKISIENEMYEIEGEFWGDEDWSVETVFLVTDHYEQLHHKSIDGFVAKWQDIILPAMKYQHLIEEGERKLGSFARRMYGNGKDGQEKSGGVVREA